MKHVLFAAAIVFAAFFAIASNVCTQELSGPPADPQLKYSTPMPPGVASPSKVETRLGTLNFFDGFPDKATADKLFDNLDFQRAVQAYLFAIPAVSQAANRNAFRTLGPTEYRGANLRAVAGSPRDRPYRQRQHRLQLDLDRPQ